jgi:formate dehydrogenase subunit gamma
VQPWAGTFAILNNFGLNLPTSFSPLEETQISVIWHSVVALVMIIIIIAHIYIGSIGMEGAFDAVGTGQVDLNWAKEHHALWVEEEMQKGGAHQPAE